MVSDSLTYYAVKFKKTKCNKAIKSIQNLVTPIAKKLLVKWKFHKFPRLIYEEAYDDSKSIILINSLNKYNIPTNCKFSSFYGTSLNFHLRSKYMKYFQKGKPVMKRYISFNTYSLDLNYADEDSSMLSYIADTKTTPLQIKISSGLSTLQEHERKVLEDIYYNDTSINKLTQDLNKKAKEIKAIEKSGLDKLKIFFYNKTLKGGINEKEKVNSN